MNIHHALSDFLFDKEYFISIFENNVFVYRYLELKLLTSSKIIVAMKEFDLVVIGKKLSINQMNKEEMLIKGMIDEVKKDYE